VDRRKCSALLPSSLQLGGLGVQASLKGFGIPGARDLSSLDDLSDLIILLLGELDVNGADIFFEVLDLLGTTSKEGREQCVSTDVNTETMRLRSMARLQLTRG